MVCMSILRGSHVRHFGKFFWCSGRRLVSKWKVENTGTGYECMHRNKCIHGSHKCDVETIQKNFGASKIPAESLSHTVSLKCAAPHLQDSAFLQLMEGDYFGAHEGLGWTGGGEMLRMTLPQKIALLKDCFCSFQ